MKLKKINEELQQALIENGLTEANTMQKETFSTMKSGSDCIIIAPKGSGKSTTIVLNVIQRLAGANEESPRALIIVEDKAKVLEMESLFEKYGKNSNLEVYGVHDKGDMEYDKNYISSGIDVLIGTPNRLSEMFTTAGYNVNRLKMFILDDADPILKLRHETKIMRISNSIVRTQRIIFSEQFTERIEVLAEKMLVEPFEFDFDGDDEDEDEEGDDEFEDEEDFEPEAGDDFEEQEGDEENGNK
jgi:ATP-dependent RNA helicase RhlE